MWGCIFLIKKFNFQNKNNKFIETIDLFLVFYIVIQKINIQKIKNTLTEKFNIFKLSKR